MATDSAYKPSKRGTSAIKANLLNPALTSHFEVLIPFPPFMQRPTAAVELDSKDQLKLNLQCSEVSLPGSNIATEECLMKLWILLFMLMARIIFL